MTEAYLRSSPGGGSSTPSVIGALPSCGLEGLRVRDYRLAMFGLINRFVAHLGQRDALVAAMTSDVGPSPGCRSFVVAHDPTHPDAVWITEVRDSRDAWQAPLEIEAVKASTEVTVPLVRDWGGTVETEVVASLRP